MEDQASIEVRPDWSEFDAVFPVGVPVVRLPDGQFVRLVQGDHDGLLYDAVWVIPE